MEKSISEERIRLGYTSGPRNYSQSIGFKTSVENIPDDILHSYHKVDNI